MKPQYSMVIRWSEEDQVYITWLPEFGEYVKTHGETYEEAAKQGLEVIEMMIESAIADGTPLPKPWLYDGDESGEEALGRLRQDCASAHQ